MATRAIRLKSLTIASLALAAVLGCTQTRRLIPFDPPVYEPFVSASDSSKHYSLNPDGTGLIVQASAVRKPREILALSSGGVYGAFTAGVLSGWTASNQRPEFDVVTGVSTGALIAPFAFLGPEYDCRANRLYVGVKAEDIYHFRSWVTIPFRDSLATSIPLKSLIESQITPDLMAKLATEHQKGRRLYVGTTNLDTKRFVVWDLGAIACQPSPKSCTLVRDILLASASVPGMLPPVAIDVEVDGKTYKELHCDGGATSTVFVPPAVFEGAKEDRSLADPSGRLTVIVAGKLFPDVVAVRRRVLPVLASTAEALLYANTRVELANLASNAKSAGLEYNQIELRQDFITVEDSLAFDKKEQTRLLAEGMRVGTAMGHHRQGVTQRHQAGTHEIRTGVRLTRVKEPGPISPMNSTPITPVSAP